MATPTPNDTHPTVGAARARQGRSGKPILAVLVISTLLAFAALMGAFFWKSGDLASTEPNNAREQADAEAFSAPEPNALNPQPAQKDSPNGPANVDNMAQQAPR